MLTGEEERKEVDVMCVFFLAHSSTIIESEERQASFMNGVRRSSNFFVINYRGFKSI